MSVRMRSLLAWIAVGLAGLALAGRGPDGATPPLGPAHGVPAEPPSAGEELVPRAAATTPRRPSEPREDRTATTGRPIPEEHGEHRRGSGDQDD